MSFELPASGAMSKRERYEALLTGLDGLLHDERNAIANCANASSLIWHTLPDLNWAGVYLWNGTELVVGPFQGKPACVRIALGRGVCGTAAARRETIVVPDVHAFPGHIACDSASNSEIVVPLLAGDRLIGVLDLDSPKLARFDGDDATHLEEFARRLIVGCDWP